MNNHITELRAALFDTLRGLKDGELDVDRAKAINDTAQVIINSAKIEIEHIKLVGGSSEFIAAHDGSRLLAGQSVIKPTQNGTSTITQLPGGATITRHKMGC